MAGMEFPLTGGCRCGALRFQVAAPPIMASVCHCTGCQRMSGGAFSTSATVPSPAFEVTSGEPVIGGIKGPNALHNHCPDCLSWVFTRMTGYDALLNVRATMFDDASWFVPMIETYGCEKLSWVTVPVRHSFDRFPSPEDYMALAAEYTETLSLQES